MIRSEDHGTTRLVRLHQAPREELDGIDSPCNLHLLRIGEVVIHGVQDHTDNAPLTVPSASCSQAYSEGVIAVQRSGSIVGRSVVALGGLNQLGPRPKSAQYAQYSDCEARQIGG